MSLPGRPTFDPLADLDARLMGLEASAGTGKTYSITTLFLRLVAEPPSGCGPDPVTPSQILVVTFTDAATAQMRERIRARLRSALDELERAALQPEWDPEDESEESRAWRESRDPDGVLRLLIRNGRAKGAMEHCARRVRDALEGFDELTISTLHGFCQRMLLRNAFESGTEFDCELSADLEPLVADIVLDYWMRVTWDLEPDLLRVLRKRAGLDHLKKVASRVASDPDLWVLPEAGSFDREARRQWRGLLERAASEWDREGPDLLDALVAACESKAKADKRLSGTWYSAKKLAGTAGRLREWLDDALTHGPDVWTRKDDQPSQDPFYPVKLLGWGHISGPGTVKGMTAPEVPGVSRTFQEILEGRDAQRDNELAFLMEIRRGLIAEVRRVLPIRKAERHLQGFDDLLRNLRDALAKSGAGDALREAIRRQYRVAIIDEFQDTDPVQWDIFRRVFGDDPEARLVLIGDPKQAIYGFRQADVEAYLEACRVLSERGGRLGGLTTNWRSDGPLVEAINHLYGDRLGDGFGREGIAYPHVGFPEEHARAPWTCPGDAGTWGAPLRLALVTRPDPEKQQDRDVAGAFAVHFTAGDILAFLDSGIVLDRPGRKADRVRPGDVAVIVRTHRQGRAMARALQRLGIPCVRRGQETVLRSEEARELLRILDGILAPRDRSAVRTALATRLVGLDAGALASLEERDADVELWRVRLERWSRLWQKHGFMRMFRDLLSETGAAARILALPDGERGLTNCLHLAELIHEAGRTGNLRPDAQRAWLARGIRGADEQTDPEAALIRLESDAQAVKIVTNHGCKGLEYPFVWVPFLWEGSGAGKGVIKFHAPDPAVPGRMRAAAHVAPEDPERAGFQELADTESLAESLRLAYVALTRARHACTVVTVNARGLESSAGAWLLLQDPGLDAGTPVRERLAGLEAVAEATDAALEDRLKRIAATSDRTIEAFAVPGEVRLPRKRWEPPADPPVTLEAESPPGRHRDPNWKRTSFSGLSRRAKDPAEVTTEVPDDGSKEHEEGDPVPRSRPRNIPGVELASMNGSEPVPEGDVDLDLYPRGRKAGEFLHKVFEVLDFHEACEDRIAGVIADAAPGFGMVEPWVDRKTGKTASLVQGVRKVLATPLGRAGTPEHRLVLSGVQSRDTLREVDFDLAVRGGFDARGGRAGEICVSHAKLAGIFQPRTDPADIATAYGNTVDGLKFGLFHGYLTGSIDLVFRWSPDGNPDRKAWKWYVVDYKSNRLAPESRKSSTWADYRPDGLRAEMVHAHYVLQYHLYVTALHRYLKQRLPGYRYEDHFGGVFYLFVRGMQGEAGRGDTGVFRDRPSLERIERLSDLFEVRT
jgi:exodeoxyribonuclease V beta subunit